MKETNIQFIYDEAVERAETICYYALDYLTKEQLGLFTTIVYLQTGQTGEQTIRWAETTLICGNKRMSLIVAENSTNVISPQMIIQFEDLTTNIDQILYLIELAFLQLRVNS